MVADGSALTLGDGGHVQISLGVPKELQAKSARIPIQLRGEGLAADGIIELEDGLLDVDHLVGYFEDLAANWRGWSGTKEFRDIEARVRLAATHDGVGSINLRVRLVDPSFQDAWWVDAQVRLEPGQLDALARDLRVLTRQEP